MAVNNPDLNASYAPGSNGLEGYFNYNTGSTNNSNTDDPFQNIDYGSNLGGFGGLYGSTDFSNTNPSFDLNSWGVSPDFSTGIGFNDFMGANDYGLSYDGSGMFPSTNDAASANAASSWPYDVSNTSFDSQDPWDKLKGLAGDYNSAMSSPLARGATTLMGLTGNSIPGLGYVNLASNAIQNPAGTAVGVGGALAQSALLGPVGGLMNMFGVNLPKMAYNYLNNSYMGEPRYGTTAADQQTAQNQGNSAMSQGIQGALGLGAGLAGLYSGIQGARSANATANSLSGMYGQNSPYAQQLRQQLARQDAAAGRRSQYGTREVELQARLAGMANQAAPNILAAQNQRYMNMARIANTIGGLSKLYPQISQGLNGLSGLFSGSQTPSFDLGNIYGSGASPSYGMNTGFLDSGTNTNFGGW